LHNINNNKLLANKLVKLDILGEPFRKSLKKKMEKKDD